MVNPQLLDYVKAQINAGYSEQAIRGVLQQSGYTLAMIEECFSSLSSQPKQQFAQATITPAPAEENTTSDFSVGGSNIKHRSVAFVLIMPIITLYIYFIYWLAKTKGEINSLGADIPTTWLTIVPIGQYYWFYKYAEGFSNYVKKDQSLIMYFLLFIFVPPVAIYMVQTELNKLAG